MENNIEGKKKVDKAMNLPNKKKNKARKVLKLLCNPYRLVANMFISAHKDLRIAKSGDKTGQKYMKLAKCDYIDDEFDNKAQVKLDLGINRPLPETEVVEKPVVEPPVVEETVVEETVVEKTVLETAMEYEKIAKTYEEELDLKEAIFYYEKSAKIYDNEGNIDKAYQCWLKLAQLAAQCGDYQKAIEFQKKITIHDSKNTSHLLKYGIYILSAAKFDDIREALDLYPEIDYKHHLMKGYMLLLNLADAIKKGDKIKGAWAIERYYQEIIHVEDTRMEYHLSRILEQVLVPQPQCIVEPTDNSTNDRDLVHFQEIIDPDNEVVPGSDFVITRLRNLETYTFTYYITKKGGNLEEFIELHKWKDGFFYDCFLVLQEEVEQIPIMKPKAFLEYLEDIIGTNKYVKKMDGIRDRLKEVNERRSGAVEMVKLAEKERDSLEGLNNDAENSKENLKAEPERYCTIVKTYNIRVEQLNLVTQERDYLKDKYNKYGKRRLEEFMVDFKRISIEVKNFYQMINQGLCKGGDVELKLVNSLAPFSEGVTFRVRPPVKNWKNIANLSGGEKILSSLAVVLALHFYKSTNLRYANVVDDTDDFRIIPIRKYLREAPPCEDTPYVLFG